MTHYRQTIRDELKARITGLPGEVGPPLESVDHAKDQGRVPNACLVLTEEGTPSLTTGDSDARVLARPLSVSIILVAKREDDLEKMAAEVERRMAGDLLGLSVEYQSTRFTQPQRGEFEFFALAINYDITYSTEEGSPDRLAC